MAIAQDDPNPLAVDRPRPDAVLSAITGSERIDLHAAILALDTFPAFSEPVARLSALLDASPVPTAAAVASVEGDVALTLAVLRTANGPDGPWAGRVESVVQAVALLQGEGLREAIRDVPVTDYFERPEPWGMLPERMRRHACATARAADRLAVHAGYRDRDRLVTVSLLHDVGALALAAHDPKAYAVLDALGDEGQGRIAREVAVFGLDHAAAGAMVLRGHGLPEALVRTVAAHHDPSVSGEAAYVRTADLLARESLGDEPDPAELVAAGLTIDLRWDDLRTVLFDLPDTGALPDRAVDPCPLSERELQVLVALAGGSVYKQIAQELRLSTSTVRTHLHNIYGKLGAVDRAQAVLIARQRGWL